MSGIPGVSIGWMARATVEAALDGDLKEIFDLERCYKHSWDKTKVDEAVRRAQADLRQPDLVDLLVAGAEQVVTWNAAGHHPQLWPNRREAPPVPWQHFAAVALALDWKDEQRYLLTGLITMSEGSEWSSSPVFCAALEPGFSAERAELLALEQIIAWQEQYPEHPLVKALTARVNRPTTRV